MPNPNRCDWLKLPGLFLSDELQGGAVPMDPLFEYLILPDRYDERRQTLFVIYFRRRPTDKDPN